MVTGNMGSGRMDSDLLDLPTESRDFSARMCGMETHLRDYA